MASPGLPTSWMPSTPTLDLQPTSHDLLQELTRCCKIIQLLQVQIMEATAAQKSVKATLTKIIEDRCIQFSKAKNYVLGASYVLYDAGLAHQLGIHAYLPWMELENEVSDNGPSAGSHGKRNARAPRRRYRCNGSVDEDDVRVETTRFEFRDVQAHSRANPPISLIRKRQRAEEMDFPATCSKRAKDESTVVEAVLRLEPALPDSPRKNPSVMYISARPHQVARMQAAEISLTEDLKILLVTNRRETWDLICRAAILKGQVLEWGEEAERLEKVLKDHGLYSIVHQQTAGDHSVMCPDDADDDIDAINDLKNVHVAQSKVTEKPPRRPRGVVAVANNGAHGTLTIHPVKRKGLVRKAIRFVKASTGACMRLILGNRGWGYSDESC